MSRPDRRGRPPQRYLVWVDRVLAICALLTADPNRSANEIWALVGGRRDDALHVIAAVKAAQAAAAREASQRFSEPPQRPDSGIGS